MAIALPRPSRIDATAERPWARRLVIALALGWLGLFLLLPLVTVFVEATRQGLGAFALAIFAIIATNTLWREYDFLGGMIWMLMLGAAGWAIYSVWRSYKTY